MTPSCLQWANHGHQKRLRSQGTCYRLYVCCLISSRLPIRALAGPMSKLQAKSFARQWTAKPKKSRSSLTQFLQGVLQAQNGMTPPVTPTKELTPTEKRTLLLSACCIDGVQFKPSTLTFVGVTRIVDGSFTGVCWRETKASNGKSTGPFSTVCKCF